MKAPKVFCIGFQKTGTTTLEDALKILGYRVTGPTFSKEKKLAGNYPDRLAEVVQKYDAFQDNPWPLFYQEMDERFPGSKFILTVRDPDRWYGSVLRHFGRQETAWRKYIYGAGCPHGNEQAYKERVIEHNKAVLKHFGDRPADLLVMDVTKGDGWDKLCPFLEHPVPPVEFPHSNSGTSIRTRILRILRRVRSAVGGG